MSEKVNILLGQGGPLSNINKIDGNFIVESTTIFNYASSGEPPTRPTRPNNSRPFIILGTYEGWSYSPESGNPFQIHNIDVNKLTHVAYAYIQPNANGSINYMDDQNDAGKRFRPFLRLKDKNENIKLLLSVGGWMEDATIFPKVIQDDATLDEFVKNLNALFKKFNFDGLNLVWLYPKTDEKSLFIKFFSKLREEAAFKDRLVTMAVSNHFSFDDFSDLNGLVDYYNIMSYGFSKYEPKTELNAPIASINHLVENLVNAEMEYKKIILGLGFRGLKFNLKDPERNGLNSDCVSLGESMTAFQIQQLMSSGMWTTVRVAAEDSVYSYLSNTWIGHEDESSISAKTQYAFTERYAGVMVDAVNCERASDCRLLNAIRTTLDEINK